MVNTQNICFCLLQGGGRWFKSSIAHLENTCKTRHFALTERGPGSASRPFCCNRAATRARLTLRQHRFHRVGGGVLHVGKDVRVGVEGDSYGGVAEHL